MLYKTAVIPQWKKTRLATKRTIFHAEKNPADSFYQTSCACKSVLSNQAPENSITIYRQTAYSHLAHGDLRSLKLFLF